jgi:8-oxo-dGTP diphosphatase
MYARKNVPASLPLFNVDVVLLSLAEDQLSVLLRRGADGKTGDRWTLPRLVAQGGDSPARVATRVARSELGLSLSWLEQVSAFAGRRKAQVGEGALTVTYLGLARERILRAAGECSWFPVAKMPRIPGAQRESIGAAMRALRERLDYSPVAFMLLPAAFTLGDLQRAYEILTGKRIHKASFRRSLSASGLVQPLDSWRSEGRGRPAQLFRYAPRRRRELRSVVRFDRLGQMAHKVL